MKKTLSFYVLKVWLWAKLDLVLAVSGNVVCILVVLFKSKTLFYIRTNGFYYYTYKNNHCNFHIKRAVKNMVFIENKNGFYWEYSQYKTLLWYDHPLVSNTIFDIRLQPRNSNNQFNVQSVIQIDWKGTVLQYRLIHIATFFKT